MSGGPYGRGKAPERACLPIDQWPDADRRLWVAACAPGDILDEEVGARSGTCADLEFEGSQRLWAVADLSHTINAARGVD
jgi:hypothetical protein